MTQERAAASDIAILVVDDDPGVRGVLADYLESEGFQVSAEACGEAALAAMDRRACDIVITDLKMPGMSGIDLVRRVRDKRPEVEAIVITGYATIQDGVEAMREGAYDFLLKPIKIDRIEAVLDRCVQWIRHKRSHAELQEVNRKLLDLTRMKEKFLAITDHELRTPVTVLDGMLHLLQKQAAEFPERARARVGDLCQVSRRLVHLVRDIHDLVQSRPNTFPVEIDQATVAGLVQSLNLDLEMARFMRNLDLSLDLDCPGDLTFPADAHRLRQAAGELFHNAVKATPDGGRVAVRIYHDAAAAPPRLCVAVTDSGVGIPADEQRRIFDVFYGLGDELHHHTSKFEFMGSGLGIGLSIALEIARAHRGGIELVSQPGEGSTFTLWVPVG
ncbi:MAG: hybrid sensor histidine kinase/response regulator [Deferrisomatales bacterium]